MRSIHDIVHAFNESLSLGEGAGIHGVGQSVLRDDDKLPAVIKQNGEAEYVGIDDKYRIRLYHKLNSVIIKRSASGYGGSAGAIVNSYSLSLVVFLNRRKANMFSDELMTMIQSQVPDFIKLKPYDQVSVSFNSAILNDLQVYNQEYSTKKYRLGPEHNLFQLNYTAEATFTKGCLNTCSS